MSFFRYIKEAFNARPWGMWIPPNWVGVAAAGMLGFIEPSAWLIGAGLEAGYLLWLANSARFRYWVDAKDAAAHNRGNEKQIASLLARLHAAEQERYRQLEARCRFILQEQHDTAAGDLQLQADGLSKLLYVYLRLLLTRSAIVRVLEGSSSKSIDLRVSEVRTKLKSATSPELQKSLNDQLQILAERKSRHAEAHDKLEFIDAELSRIQEQVELIREGLAVSTDPSNLSRRIDRVGDTLSSTNQWIKQQQELLGDAEDLLEDQPPVVLEIPRTAQSN